MIPLYLHQFYTAVLLMDLRRNLTKGVDGQILHRFAHTFLAASFSPLPLTTLGTPQ